MNTDTNLNPANFIKMKLMNINPKFFTDLFYEVEETMLSMGRNDWIKFLDVSKVGNIDDIMYSLAAYYQSLGFDVKTKEVDNLRVINISVKYFIPVAQFEITLIP